MCFNDATIEVPQALCQTMLDQGATCGGCDERCCPDEQGDKIDMCLNGNTINVSRNACKGILTAGGACGPCVEEVEAVLVEGQSIPAKASATKGSKKAAATKASAKAT